MRHLLAIITFPLLFACSQNEEITDLTETNVHSLDLEYAKHIKLIDENGDLRIDIYNPDKGTLEASVTPQNGKELRIISMSATTNGILAQLGEQDLIVGVSSRSELYDEKLIKRFKDGFIAEFFDEEIYSLEKIIACEANVILYSGYNREFPNTEKLKKLGVQLIPIYDWREEHPFGKTEWIKVIGLLTGHKDEANSYFTEVLSKYNALKEMTNPLKGNPTVISGNIFNDIWYTPVGDSYMARLISDAGGDYVYKDSKGTGSLAMSIEKILGDNHETEIWINPGIDSKEKILKMNPHAKYLKAFDNIYCYSGDLNKFWEQSALMPDKVLSDLIQIFHPELQINEPYYFYSKIN